MEKEQWEELQAQVETHGPNAVAFYYKAAAEVEELWIMDIKFDGDEIKVELE